MKIQYKLKLANSVGKQKDIRLESTKDFSQVLATIPFFIESTRNEIEDISIIELQILNATL